MGKTFAAYGEAQETNHGRRPALVEAHLPEEIEETVEDLIREAAHPVKLSNDAVSKLKLLLESRASLEPVQVEVRGDARLKLFNEFIDHFTPKEWTMVNWWALQFAIRSKQTDGKSPSMIAETLGMQRQLFHYYIRIWREKLNLPKHDDAMREGVRLMWAKDRRKTPRIKPATARH